MCKDLWTLEVFTKNRRHIGTGGANHTVWGRLQWRLRRLPKGTWSSLVYGARLENEYFKKVVSSNLTVPEFGAKRKEKKRKEKKRKEKKRKEKQTGAEAKK